MFQNTLKKPVSRVHFIVLAILLAIIMSVAVTVVTEQSASAKSKRWHTIVNKNTNTKLKTSRGWSDISGGVNIKLKPGVYRYCVLMRGQGVVTLRPKGFQTTVIVNSRTNKLKCTHTYRLTKAWRFWFPATTHGARDLVYFKSFILQRYY